MLKVFLPYIFVFLWSTGFIGAKFGLPHAPPLSFLAIRYFLVVLILLALVRVFSISMLVNWRQCLHIGIAGLGIHGFYLSGVFIAIAHGLPAGVTALIVGLQPILTAVIQNSLSHEKILARQWLGLIAGFCGVLLVVSGKIGGEFTWLMILPAIVALVSITFGTIYQKRYCLPFDWRSGGFWQFLPSAVLTLICASYFETGKIDWSGDFIFALAWLVLVLSIAAIALLNWLIRSGSAVNVSSLFYLTPPSTALIAWLLFDEKMTWLMLLGMVITIVGVYQARAKS